VIIIIILHCFLTFTKLSELFHDENIRTTTKKMKLFCVQKLQFLSKYCFFSPSFSLSLSLFFLLYVILTFFPPVSVFLSLPFSSLSLLRILRLSLLSFFLSLSLSLPPFLSLFLSFNSIFTKYVAS